jgi:SAM-dependent methyltransferase
VTSLDLADDSFDTVCSFETVEHLDDVDAYVGEMRRVLRPGGTFVVSTPRVDKTTETPDNPYHAVELSRDDLERLLRGSFDQVDLYGQRRLQTRRHRALQRLDVLGLRRRLTFLRPAAKVLGTAPMAEVGSEGIVIERDGLDRATELIAVCR